MKLSITQQRILDQVWKEVNEAREAIDFEDWYERYYKKYSHNLTLENLREKFPSDFELAVKVYNERLNGIVLTNAKGATIRKLESFGFIEIIKDATGTGSYSFDTIRVIKDN